jgi:hypothetical protein
MEAPCLYAEPSSRASNPPLLKGYRKLKVPGDGKGWKKREDLKKAWKRYPFAEGKRKK